MFVRKLGVFVIPAEAGIQSLFEALDSRSTNCGNDIKTIYKQTLFTNDYSR